MIATVVAAVRVAALTVVLAVEGHVEIAQTQAPPMPDRCRETLHDERVQLRPWPLRPERLRPGVACEAPGGVEIHSGAAGIRYRPPARVNCAFALRLIRFERIVQEEAKLIMRSPVRSVEQLGTYSCRNMAAYPDLISEHSFANAIDISTFIFQSGRQVSVERDWVRADRPAGGSAAMFLRRVTRRLFDEQVFSVVLTPSFDRLHRNHLHLDGAAYRLDGT